MDMLNYAFLKNGTMNVWFDALMLAGYSVLLFDIGLANIKEKWIL